MTDLEAKEVLREVMWMHREIEELCQLWMKPRGCDRCYLREYSLPCPSKDRMKRLRRDMKRFETD